MAEIIVDKRLQDCLHADGTDGPAVFFNGEITLDITFCKGNECFERHVAGDLLVSLFRLAFAVHDRLDLEHPGTVDIADKLLNIRIARIEQDMLRLTLPNNETILENDQMVSQFQRFIKIMGDKDDRRAGLSAIPEEDPASMSGSTDQAWKTLHP